MSTRICTLYCNYNTTCEIGSHLVEGENIVDQNLGALSTSSSPILQSD
jgi:hypothetical protein